MKDKKNRDEVSSILADPLRDRLTLVLLFFPYFSPQFKLHLSPLLFVTSLSRSLLSHRGFRSICSRGVIYSLRGNKGISHISLIFTLHNSTFLSISLPLSFSPLISLPAGVSPRLAAGTAEFPNLHMLYVAKNSNTRLSSHLFP